MTTQTTHPISPLGPVKLAITMDDMLLFRGVPMPKTHTSLGIARAMNSAAEMLEAAGLTNVTTYDDGSAPGLCIHEMGTARMGRDPRTSVLNQWNQVHASPNVFVTDGACMTSSACVNPSLTYMALTARAANFAVAELKRGNL